MIYLQLLVSFLQVGLFSIGGGYATLPLIQQQIVEGRGWLTMREFTDIITLSQMTPGPLAVNASTFVGIRVAGIGGAIVATLGCIAPGLTLALLLFRLLSKTKAPALTGMLGGMRAASVGLIGASGASLSLAAFTGGAAISAITQVDFCAVIIFITVIVLYYRLRMSPILLIVLSGAFGFLMYFIP